jgi:hypothetical protein
MRQDFNVMTHDCCSLTLDTTDERNGLIERVYPRLREYCLTKYNIQFQVI